MDVSVVSIMWSSPGIGYDPRGDEPVPDKQDQQCADGSPDKARTLVWPIPANRLADPGREECATNAENRGQDEARGIVRSRRETARNNSRHKADQNNPDDAQARSYPLIQ